MLPAMVDRFQPALAIMQSVTSMQARILRDDAPNALARQAAAPAKDMKAINDYYFGGHLTVTEAMTKLVEKVVGYLNEKLAVGRDGSEADVETGNRWRAQALRDDIEVNGKDDFSIPKPGDDGVSFQRVARMIQSAFDTDFLSRDLELKKLLEDMIGFRLDGMSVADLLEAVADPGGKAAQKVGNVLTEGLAGQAGSKVSQRLERAASGPKSVEETLAETQKASIDEVDEETLAEDLEAVRTARARERLEQAARLPDDIADALDEAREQDRNGRRVEVKIAMAVIQALGNLGEAEAKPGKDGDDSAGEGVVGDVVSAAFKTSDAPDAIEEEGTAADFGERPVLTSIVRAYLETLEPEEEQEERFSLLL